MFQSDKLNMSNQIIFFFSFLFWKKDKNLLLKSYLESRPEMELPKVEALEGPFSFGKTRNHRLGPVRESPDIDASVVTTKNSNNESLGGRFRKRMGIEENNSRDGGGGEALSEKVNNQNTSSDENYIASGIEGEALISREVGSDLRWKRGQNVGIISLRSSNGSLITLNYGLSLGRRGGKN